MPLKSGYSHATFAANVAELIRSGHERNSAIMAAASAARKSFFKRFPKGALPNWLAFPKTHRLANHYTSSGQPLMHASEVQANPKDEPDAQSLSRAVELYEGFTDQPPRVLKKLTLPAPPKAALAIGKVFGIMYSVDATGERFHHEFKQQAQPTLIVSHDGHQVFLRGGAYTFTERGFVDHKRRTRN